MPTFSNRKNDYFFCFKHLTFSQRGSSAGLHRGRGDSFAEQLENTFASLRKTLAEYTATLDDLVKINVWLKNIQDLPEMEKLFRSYFGKGTPGNDRFPARMTATTEFIDADCLLMIDGVAYRKSASLSWANVPLGENRS